MKKILILLTGLAFTACSVTVGTVNINDDGKPKTDTEIVQQKPVTVDTKATVPVSAIP